MTRPEPEDFLRDLPGDAPVGPVLQGQAPEFSKSGLLRSGVVVALLSGLGNLLNVVFHFSVARLLKPDEYALLNTIFAVNVIATIPLIAVQANLVRELSVLLGKGEADAAGAVLRSTFAIVLRFAIVVCFVMAVLAWPAIEVLNIERPLPIIAAALSILIAVPLPAAWGALQASERFAALGWLQSMASSLKLVFGLGLAVAGFGASAITFGVVAASAVALLVALLVLRPLWSKAKAGIHLPARRLIGRYTLAAAIGLAFSTMLTQSDLIWSRGSLPPDAAGDYAAASVITGFILLLPVVVTTVLFPRIARLGDDPVGRQALVLGLAVVAGLSAVLLALFAACPTLLLHIAMGTQYDGAAPWLLPLGVAMTGYALATVYFNHFLAQGGKRYAVVLGIVFVVQQVLFLRFHASGWQIVWVQFGCGLALVFASEVFERQARFRIVRRRTRYPGVEGPASGSGPRSGE
ncbi:MAG TPA: oligosaccharide flippase family protein [Solirubrobacterales bacterium]|nr:oligosaccharide flippase family protein [Solirubrobacterales bacterium]